METQKQLGMVKCAISAYLGIPPQQLKFDHGYGGFVWNTIDDDTYYVFVACITHPHKTVWAIMTDEVRLCDDAKVIFTMEFPTA